MAKQFFYISMGVLALLIIQSDALARTWYITPDGLGDAPTIQAGVDSAAVGDTVLLGCGTYHDCTHPDGAGVLNCVIMKDGITLLSETGQPDCATIDAQGAGRGILCSFVDDVVLKGLTLTNGTVPYEGGGVLCRSSTVLMEDCVILGNTAYSGGGMRTLSADLTITRTLFAYNETVDSWFGGGGIYFTTSSCTMTDCDIRNNTNGTGWGGGGILFHGGGPYLISDCRFRENISLSNPGGGNGNGGAVYFYGGRSSEFTDCYFEGNISEQHGGGMILEDDAPGLLRCTFSNNTANMSGGAIYLGTESLIENCTFAGNTAPDGGAAIVRYSSPTIRQCTIFGNEGISASGIYADASSDLTIENAVIAGGLSGPALACNTGASVTLTCCDIYDNEGGNWDDCISDQAGINSNFSADPLFCDPDADEFSLHSDSPCAPGNHPDGAACGLIGALEVGCGSTTAVETMSWGGIKSLFK